MKYDKVDNEHRNNKHIEYRPQQKRMIQGGNLF
jgi:hypothetical protein